MKIEIDHVKTRLRVFIIVLILSGLSVYPVELELNVALGFIPDESTVGKFLSRVLDSYSHVAATHNFLLYGYDWLAFAHFVLAILFIGPLRDPVKNIWVIEFGLIACALIIPFALIAGSFRGIPIWWRLVDCSFGVFGFICLRHCYILIRSFEHNENEYSF